MQFTLVKHRSAVTMCRHAHALCVLNFPPVQLDDPAEFARRIVGQEVAGLYRITAMTFNFYPDDDVYYPQIHISNLDNLSAVLRWPAARVTLDDDYRVRVMESDLGYVDASGDMVAYDMEHVTVYGFMGVTERTQSQVPRRDKDLMRFDFSTKAEVDCSDNSWDVPVKRSKGPLVNTQDLARVGRAIASQHHVEMQVALPLMRAFDQIGRGLPWHFGYDAITKVTRGKHTVDELHGIVLHGLWLDYIEYVDTSISTTESRPAFTAGDYPRDVTVRRPFYNSLPLAYLMALRQVVDKHNTPAYIDWQYNGDKVLRNDEDDIERLYRGEGDHMVSWAEWQDLVTCVSAESVHQLHGRYTQHLADNPDTDVTALGFYLLYHVKPILEERVAKARELQRQEEERKAEERLAAERREIEEEAAQAAAEQIEPQAFVERMKSAYEAYRGVTPPAGQRHMPFGQFKTNLVQQGYGLRTESELINIGRGFNEFVDIQH